MSFGALTYLFSERLNILFHCVHLSEKGPVPVWGGGYVCRSGLRGPLAYSLLGGGIPTQSIG